MGLSAEEIRNACEAPMGGTYNCPRTCSSDEMQFTINVANLVSSGACGAVKGNHNAVIVLELKRSGSAVGWLIWARKGLTKMSWLVVLERHR